MFDQEKAMAAWRARMLDGGLLERELEELESHLREQVQGLGGGGLSDEEAFLVAARRLGDPEALSAEFASADPTRVRVGRVYWATVGCLLMVSLYPAVKLLGLVALWTWAWLLPGALSRASTLVYLAHSTSAVLVFSLLGYGAYRWLESRDVSRWGDQLVRWSARPWLFLFGVLVLVAGTGLLTHWSFEFAVLRLVPDRYVFVNYVSMLATLALPTFFVLLLRRQRRLASQSSHLPVS